MRNRKLAASGNLPLNQKHGASQLAGRINNRVHRLMMAVHRADKKVERFFNSQAQVRSRKVTRPECGWSRYEGFQ